MASCMFLNVLPVVESSNKMPRFLYGILPNEGQFWVFDGHIPCMILTKKNSAILGSLMAQQHFKFGGIC